MSDVHNSQAIIENAVKDLEGIANERHDMQARPLFDRWRAKRLSANAVNHRADASFKGFGHTVAEGPPAVQTNLAKVGDRPFRILNLHARRNARNAASTSSSVATPLRSASSMTWSSAGVAR